MNNKILTLLVFIYLISCSSQLNENSDLTEKGLKMKVKSYSEISYEANEKFGEIHKGERRYRMGFSHDSKFQFDKNGNMVEESWYDENSNLDISFDDFYLKMIKKYDDKERLIEYTRYERKGNIDKGIISYNQKGNKIEDNHYYNSIHDNKHSYVYDINNNLIEEIYIIFKSNDTLVNPYRTYKYDDSGNQIEENIFLDGQLYTKIKSKYDKRGNEIESNYYNSDGSLKQRYTFKYNIIGKETEEKQYNPDGNLYYQWTFKYDIRGRIKIEGDYKPGFFKNIAKYKYDKKGNLIQKKHSSSKVNKYDLIFGSKKHGITKYKYEYDHQGNWIKRIEFENNIPLIILEREIEYFE